MNFADVQTIFFDLDNTLFDHTRAEQAALRDILRTVPEIRGRVAPDIFLETYHRINSLLWRRMAAGMLTAEDLKILRLQNTFGELGLPVVDFAWLSQRYLEIYATKTFAVPNAKNILDYLKHDYSLGILSNGFTEIQESKLNRLNLQQYFQYRIFSADVGAMKPSKQIFDAALATCGCLARQVVYVGDSYEDDILGARQAGWRAIYINQNSPSFQDGRTDAVISDLLELKKVFAR